MQTNNKVILQSADGSCYIISFRSLYYLLFTDWRFLFPSIYFPFSGCQLHWKDSMIHVTSWWKFFTIWLHSLSPCVEFTGQLFNFASGIRWFMDWNLVFYGFEKFMDLWLVGRFTLCTRNSIHSGIGSIKLLPFRYVWVKSIFCTVGQRNG